MNMMQRWRAAGLIVPTIMTAVLLPFLLGLGVWQMQRKAWKEDLIAKIEARTSSPAIDYAAAVQQAGDDLKSAEYLRVRVSGRYDHATERHVYAPKPKGPGWNVYTVLTPDSGLPRVMINRGWVPQAKKPPETRTQAQLDTVVTVTGLLRAPEVPGSFTPDANLVENRWYARDLDGMKTSLGLDGSVLAPFMIDAEATPANPGGWPEGGTTEVKLSNPHLQYVVTWFGIALTLLGVFVVFARQRLAALSDDDERPEMNGG